MITFTKAYVTGGKTFATLEEAQAAEVAALFKATPGADPVVVVMENADKIVSILTTTNSSRPRARKENGGTKQSRKPKTPTVIASETAA
jgi:hypothetical protein